MLDVVLLARVEYTSEGNLRDYVTIVSGLPRSGTSMMMRMLEAGGMSVLADGIRVADEDNLRGYYEFEAVKKTKQDPSWLESAAGKTVKMVYRLLYDLPADYRYRVLMMGRHMTEILASQRKMLKRQGQGANVISDEQLEQVFRRDLSRFKAWLVDQSHIDVLEVDYNRMVAAPEAELNGVSQFLGGDLDVPAMCRVVEPDLYRNRS